MTVENLRVELETIISNLTAVGFTTIDASTMDKLEKLAAAAEELNMKEGKRLISNLLDTMKAILEGKSKAESCCLRLTALDFYIKKQAGSDTVEDL